PADSALRTFLPVHCLPRWRVRRRRPARRSAPQAFRRCADTAIPAHAAPQMRKHGYSGDFSAGIIAAGGTLGILLPPSITMILYAVAAEQSLGRLFLAAIGPAVLLGGLFTVYAVWRFRWEYEHAKRAYERAGTHSEILRIDNLS